MKAIVAAVAILLAHSVVSAQEPAAQNLKLTLTADRAKAVLGQEIQFEVKLENAGDKEVEVAELTYEERSFSLAVSATFTAPVEKKRDYVLAVSRPEPQIAARLPLPRVTLGAKKSVTFLHRTPAIGVGKFDYMAKYAGGAAEISSAAVKIEVEGTNQGDRLAAVVDIEETGSFKILLTPEVSPANVTNLASLVLRGFYNESLVHRIIRDNWIHMGCPYGIGFGGPGYALKGEPDRTVHHEPGTVSMSGYDKTNYTGSQFFICLGTLPWLDGKYTPVGRVENDEFVKIIQPVSKRDSDRNTDAPKTPIKVKTVTLAVVK